MKPLQGLALLLLMQSAGEALSHFLQLPVPGPVVGMVLLLLALRWAPVQQAIAPAAGFLLTHLSLLEAAGEDAKSFLHSQFTSDINHLADGQAQHAGWCSAKGRMQASFLAWRDGGRYRHRRHSCFVVEQGVLRQVPHRVVALLGVGVEIMDHRLEQLEVRRQAAGADLLQHEADGVQDRGERLVLFGDDAQGFHVGSPVVFQVDSSSWCLLPRPR